MEKDRIHLFLTEVGKRYPRAADLYLLGGSALCLLGSPRPTLDIDYVGDDLKKDELQSLMEQTAREMGLDVEAVPIDRFIPLPAGAGTRSLDAGIFGNITVHIFDPYSMALAKIDRGFDTDLEDVRFLIKRGYVRIGELERITRETMPRAREFDIDSGELLAHLEELKKIL